MFSGPACRVGKPPAVAVAGVGVSRGEMSTAPESPWAVQTLGGMARIGYLGAGPGLPSPLVDAFRRGLRELGYVEGQNIHVEYRFAAFRPERYPQLVDELISLPVDLIVTADSEATPVARMATTTIPIV